MKVLAVFAVVILTVNASTDGDKWMEFKQTHGKTYKSLLEERTRFGIFQSNLRRIEEHNAKYDNGEESYWMGVTRFADLTRDEYRTMLRGQLKSKPNFNATRVVFPENLEIPDAIDWTKKGAVLKVKSQETCGSCWAFSATGAMEGQNAIKHNVKIPLSEQQLLDCSGSYGNGNCDEGGEMTFSFNYVKDKGIEAETSYPYKGKQTRCQANSAKTVLKVKGYKSVSRGEAQLEKAVATIGPISVALNADPLDFYEGGIISGRVCTEELDHAVLVVGYGVQNGIKYWKIKNSWGGVWGEQGYYRLRRDANNLCGVADEPVYPLL